MHIKLPLIYLLILILLTSSCEDFYNFEANKLNKKVEELIKESENIQNVDEKIILLSNAIEKLNKIQRKYPKTKIARNLRKNKKIDELNVEINSLEKLSSIEKKEKKKIATIEKIEKLINSANLEFKNKNFILSIQKLIEAAELSIYELKDARSKTRLLNNISRIKISLNDKNGALKTLNISKSFLDKTHGDLPKKIKNLSYIYEMLSELNNGKKDDVEKEIYKIINTEIQNKNNKAVALLEIAKTNINLKNIEKVKKDIKIASKFAEKSNVYLEIAKLSHKINNLEQTKLFLEKSKTAAESKDQVFWIVRELINIAEFENSIQENNASNKTLMDAKEYVLKNLDERIFIEIISSFAKINNLEQAKELLNLMKPGYEKAMAMSLVGNTFANKKDYSVMESFLNEALNTVPDLIGGKYALGLPGFSTKAKIFLYCAKSYALAGNFDKAHKILSQIESDRFYKEGIIDILHLQAKSNMSKTTELSINILNLGGKIVDNKFIGNIATILSVSGDIDNSLKTVKRMKFSVALSQTLINIAQEINLQQEDPLI